MSLYVIRLEEITWGSLLVAVTMAIHGVGMLVTLRVTDAIKDRFKESMSIFLSLGIVILASWMIILTSAVEIWVWGEFFVLMGALPNRSTAIYYALVNYTTLDSGYLPLRWHLLISCNGGPANAGVVDRHSLYADRRLSAERAARPQGSARAERHFRRAAIAIARPPSAHFEREAARLQLTRLSLSRRGASATL